MLFVVEKGVFICIYDNIHEIMLDSEDFFCEFNLEFSIYEQLKTL